MRPQRHPAHGAGNLPLREHATSAGVGVREKTVRSYSATGSCMGRSNCSGCGSVIKASCIVNVRIALVLQRVSQTACKQGAQCLRRSDDRHNRHGCAAIWQNLARRSENFWHLSKTLEGRHRQLLLGAACEHSYLSQLAIGTALKLCQCCHSHQPHFFVRSR